MAKREQDGDLLPTLGSKLAEASDSHIFHTSSTRMELEAIRQAFLSNCCINNVRVPNVDEVILVRHYMCDDIYKFNASKCVSDFNRQNNIFFANFKLTRILEMCCFISTAQLFMAARCSQCLETVCRSFTLH